jgi:hypothetical protein
MKRLQFDERSLSRDERTVTILAQSVSRILEYCGFAVMPSKRARISTSSALAHNDSVFQAEYRTRPVSFLATNPAPAGTFGEFQPESTLT